MIYLLEDDVNIQKFVIYALENTGFQAKGFEMPSQFYEALKRKLPELIILDVMLPQEDGISVLKKLRRDPATSRLPIIMLTAKSSEYDKIMGLDSGADDYVAKPFSVMELIARIKALLRRTDTETGEQVYTAGEIAVYPQRHVVECGGVQVQLTLKEYELLCLLIKNKGMVFTRDQILQDIWGYDFDGENRTVDVHIRTLRAKLGKGGGCIETVRGFGYKIDG